MATVAASLPFPQGTTVQLAAAVSVFADKTEAYVCEYYHNGSAFRVIVRVEDDKLGSFDLDLALTGIEALGTA